MFFAGWEVRMVKNCDLGLENAVAFMSPAKFSNIVFPVWNFVRSLKFYYKTIFGQSLPLKLLEIRLLAESDETLQVYSTEIILKTATIRGKFDWN